MSGTIFGDFCPLERAEVDREDHKEHLPTLNFPNIVVSATQVGNYRHSGAWEPPQFQEKRAILGALGEFRGVLGAALGIGNSILGIRNSILGMASHDLINTKPTILGATPGAIPGIAANPPERFSFAPAFSERFFKNWGGPRAPESYSKLLPF